jgi:hypothetical protein
LSSKPFPLSFRCMSQVSVMKSSRYFFLLSRPFSFLHLISPYLSFYLHLHLHLPSLPSNPLPSHSTPPPISQLNTKAYRTQMTNPQTKPRKRPPFPLTVPTSLPSGRVSSSPTNSPARISTSAALSLETSMRNGSGIQDGRSVFGWEYMVR